MSPADGVPLHFTVEAIGLGVAGVAAAWAALSRRRVATAGAALVAFAQIAYAGQFFAPEDAGAAAAGVVRLAGLVLLAAGGIREADRAALLSGSALVAGGTVWRIATDGGPATLAVGARALTGVGFVVLAVWAWRRASASVRSRIVAAFLGVLSVAVVVMGGAAARVSVTDALDDARTRMEAAIRSEQDRLNQRVTDLVNRAAVASAVVSRSGSGTATLSALRRQAFPDTDFVSFLPKTGTPTPPLPDGIQPAAVRSVAAALGGRGATGAVALSDGAMFVSAQPVFREGPGRSPADIAGALAVGFRFGESDLRAVAARAGDTRAQLVLTGRGPVARVGEPFELLLPHESIESGQAIEPRTGGAADAAFASATIRTTDPEFAVLALYESNAAVADIPSAFPRALVGGVLVASLLAVVLALWLAARITRPILLLADEAERVKSDFLSTVSHELRTPLTPIRGYANLLRTGRVPRRRAETYLDEIDVAARRLERIVSLLVEVAAIEAGRFTPELEPVAPGDLLTDAAERWEGRSRRHRFAVRTPKSLPRVNADERAMATVLDELIDNAVKFSPNGGTVELRARRAGDRVEIAVADQGIGLDAGQLEELTAAFVQAEPGETRRFGGIGLGLTYAAGVLVAHGARLDVEASKDGGATFSFALSPIGTVSRMSGRGRDSDVTR